MWSNISAPLNSPQGEQQVTSLSSNGLNVKLEKKAEKKCGSPLTRYKHAACSAPSTGYIYIHGGRLGNLPLDDDVWRFDPHQNSWLQLDTSGNKPPSLQEHSLIEHNDCLYLFGGQVSASSGENSFWRLDLASGEWRSLNLVSSKFGAHLRPTNRRGHSAVVHADSMYIYGGFEDFRGSSGQLWQFDLINESWELSNLSATAALHPEPRHSHSAVVYEDQMYVYGGLSNLKPLGDLWRWSWLERRWFKERTKGQSPGQLHGHTAIQAFGSMFVFGGERNGRPTRSLWRLNLSNLTWQKVRPKGPRPNPTTWHAAIANPLSILDETNYIIEGGNQLREVSSFGSTGANQMMLRCGLDTTTTTTCSSHLANEASSNDIEHVKAQNGHSKSSSDQRAPVGSSCPPVAASRASVSKRKSRLNFLRRCRPRSAYELKQQPQMHLSAWAVNFTPSAMSHNRHSVHAGLFPGRANPKPEVKAATETNPKVLMDNLDTDIKRMFRRAMSPEMRADEEPMCVEIQQVGSTMTITATGTNLTSRYETATMMNADCPRGNRPDQSQRTSYAYTTPPSEMNTLRESSTDLNSRPPISHHSHNYHQRQQQQRRWPAVDSAPSGYDRRNNRPKSEIVQSLIDQADNSINHLYTSFFNHQPQQQQKSIIAKDQEQDARGDDSSSAQAARLLDDHRKKHRETSSRLQRHSFQDKSKRHTLPETMTYYNLYFSEDLSSNSPVPAPRSRVDGQQGASTRDVDYTTDDTSSNGTSRPAEGSGTLIGVHHSASTQMSSSGTLTSRLSGGLRNNEEDESGQLESPAESLRTEPGQVSESRTLCGTINEAPVHEKSGSNSSGSGTNGTTLTGGSSSLMPSSLPNALTAKRDTTTAESCGDNTSMSFSAIAEFEEDDMLQYSSPAHYRIIEAHEYNGHRIPGASSSDAPTARQAEVSPGETHEDSPTQQPTHAMMAPQKSTSSGYDSISGSYENNRTQESGTGSQRAAQELAASDTTTQEDGSLFSSSMGTSPEQSGPRYVYPPHSGCQQQKQPTKSLPSSPPASTGSCQQVESSSSNNNNEDHQLMSDSSAQRATQAKSLRPSLSMSRSAARLFSGKRKCKTRYWQLCMFVIGGKQGGAAHSTHEPMTIWRLYI